MSLVTPKLGLVKPAGIEQFNLATYNNNLDLIDADAVSNAASIKSAAKVLGVGTTGIAWGTYPTVNSDIKFYFGSYAGSTDASGYVGIDLPSAFPNGYFIMGLSNGDVAAQVNITFGLTTSIFTNTASRFYLRVITANTGAALASTSFRVNYLAIGH